MLSFLSLVLCLFTTGEPATAAPSKVSPSFGIYVRALKESKTLADLEKAVGPRTFKTDATFLRQQIGDQSIPLPKVIRATDRSFTLQGDMLVTVELDPAHAGVYRINNHVVDLSQIENPQEVWRAVEAALPRRHARLDLSNFLFPEAYAGALSVLKKGVELGANNADKISQAYTVASTGAEYVRKGYDAHESICTKFGDLHRQCSGAHENLKDWKSSGKPNSAMRDEPKGREVLADIGDVIIAQEQVGRVIKKLTQFTCPAQGKFDTCVKTMLASIDISTDTMQGLAFNRSKQNQATAASQPPGGPPGGAPTGAPPGGPPGAPPPSGGAGTSAR